MIGGQNGYIVAGRGRGYFEIMFAAGLQLQTLFWELLGSFLVVQWLRLQASTSWGTRSICMLQGMCKKKKKNDGVILEFDIVPKVQVLRDLRTCLTPHPWMATWLHFECVNHGYFFLIFKWSWICHHLFSSPFFGVIRYQS